MSIQEASQLILQCGSFGKDGEIFLLEMGKPIKILNMAKDLIRLSGFEPEIDIPIVFTGLRPGEKLYEELQLKQERKIKTQHKNYGTQRQHCLLTMAVFCFSSTDCFLQLKTWIRPKFNLY